MKPENDPDQIKNLEAKLGKLSKVTLSQNFPSWDDLSRREIKYPELYSSSETKTNLIRFPHKGKFLIGSALLAAASFTIVFLLNRTPSDVPSNQVAEVAPAFASVPAPQFNLLLGSISQSKGKNKLKKSDEMEIPMQNGMEVSAGDRLLVGKSGTIDISFPNHVFVRVLGDTEIEIVDSKSLLDSTQQLIRIWRGKVLITLGKLTKDSSFQIASGQVDTMVRGTTFSVSYDGKTTQTIAVREGSVSVLAANQEESVIEPGKQIQYTDTVPSPVQDIAIKEDKEMKALQTQVTLTREAKLYAEYSRLELVRMEDGTEYRGVIMGQSATHLHLETTEGRLEIPIGKIQETEKIR